MTMKAVRAPYTPAMYVMHSHGDVFIGNHADMKELVSGGICCYEFITTENGREVRFEFPIDQYNRKVLAV